MKKLFTASLALALIMSLAATSLAVSKEDIVKKDDDYYDDVITSITPGDTVYVILVGPDDYKADKKPKSIKWEDISVDAENTSTSKRYLSVSSSPTKLKVNSTGNKYAWGAKLDAKSIKASDYENALDVTGTISFRLNNISEEIDITTTIEYEEGSNELDDDVFAFEYDRNDDIDIDFPDGDGYLTGTANKDFVLLASMNTNYNSTIGNKYPNASMNFYNGNGVSLTYIKNPRLIFKANQGTFLYEIGADNTLTDLSGSYSSKDNAFIVSARALGKYVVSDRALSATGSIDSTKPAPDKPVPDKKPSTGNAGLDNLTALIGKNFSNKFILLSNGTVYGVNPKAMTYSVSVDLSGMNPADLCLYTYDAANNRLIGSANKPKVGADGNLYLTTNTIGYYVVSSGSLSK